VKVAGNPDSFIRKARTWRSCTSSSLKTVKPQVTRSSARDEHRRHLLKLAILRRMAIFRDLGKLAKKEVSVLSTGVNPDTMDSWR
jgi:hypothetical protein